MLHRVTSLRAALLLAVLGLIAAPLSAQDGVTEQKLQEATRLLWDDDSNENRVRAARLMIEAADGRVPLIERALRRGTTYSADVKTGEDALTFLGRTGEAQVAGVYVPTSYTPEKAWPMLVWLHGQASGDAKNRGTAQVAMWKAFCEQNGIVLVCPSAYQGSAWWELDGVYNTLRAMKMLKTTYNIDEDRVYVAGFADGGAGVYYILDHFATYFAGGLVFSAHPAVAGAEQAYGQFSYYNLRNRPLYVAAGGKDRLFPPDRIKPFVDTMIAAQVRVTWRVFDNAGHNPAYIADALGDVKKFIDENTRNPAPKVVSLEWDGTPALNRCDWLLIDEVRKEGGNDAKLPDIATNLQGQAALGVSLGEPLANNGGLPVTSVEDGSAAQIGGIEPDDVIKRFNDTPIATADDLTRMLGNIRPGDLSHVWVHRPAEKADVELIVEFPPARKVFKRTNPMGVAIARITRSTKKGEANVVEIKTRGVERVTVLLQPELLDLDELVTIKVNGDTINIPAPAGGVAGKFGPDANFCIRMVGGDRDRRLIYFNRVSVSVPRGW